MNAEEIKVKTREYLKQLSRGEVDLPLNLTTEYLEHVAKRVNKDRKQGFTLRMSTIGRPLCQLQHEHNKTLAEPRNEYQRQYTFMVGDMSELWLMMIMKAAGIPVDDYDIHTSVELYKTNIQGTVDIVIAGGIWDIKTTSSASFKKYTDFGGFSNLVEDDPFGYVVQGVLYSKALGLPFKGWIILNKNTGDIDICETPINFSEYEKSALEKAEIAVKTIIENLPFQKQFTDEEETFKKKITGNRILGKTCSWCDYVKACWPQAVYRPSVVSESKTPAFVYYTHIKET